MPIMSEEALLGLKSSWPKSMDQFITNLDHECVPILIHGIRKKFLNWIKEQNNKTYWRDEILLATNWHVNGNMSTKKCV